MDLGNDCFALVCVLSLQLEDLSRSPPRRCGENGALEDCDKESKRE